MNHSGTIFASDAVAAARRKLREARVVAVSLCGSPGSGKTALLEETLRRIGSDMRAGVIVANPKAERDISRLRAHVRFAAEIHSAELSAGPIVDTLAHADLRGLDVLFIETLGGIADTAPADLGQDVRVAIFSVAAGDDKAVEFPRRVATADLLLLNKMDLLPHVKFNPDAFRADARRINPAVEVIEVSAAGGGGLDQWEKWLREAIRRHRTRNGGGEGRPSESFIG
jgi:hydrogenase nickel incorporation protein HypB